MTIFSNLTKLTEKVNLLSFQSKWSGLKKKVILSENSCHCNELQCILYEGDKLGADIPLPINVRSPLYTDLAYVHASGGFLL